MPTAFHSNPVQIHHNPTSCLKSNEYYFILDQSDLEWIQLLVVQTEWIDIESKSHPNQGATTGKPLLTENSFIYTETFLPLKI